MNLNIPHPCTENRHSFQKTKDGGFCQKCQKEVIDFTTFSDTELKQYFLANTNKKVCGRLLPEQLGISLNPQSKISGLSGVYWGIGLSFMILQKSYSQQIAVIKNNTVQRDTASLKSTNPENNTKNRLIKISGRIKDAEDKSGLPGVNVWLKNTTLRTSADEQGRFELIVPVDTLMNSHIIVISYIGFNTEELNIDKILKKLISEDINHLILSNVLLQSDVQWMGEIVVTYKSPSDWLLKKIKSVFCRFRRN